MNAETLLSRLGNCVKEVREGEWWAQCPAHDDYTPSLHITEIQDGTILIHDFGGCSPAEVLAAVGLELADLFPKPLEPYPRRKQRQYVNPRDLLRLVSGAATILFIFTEDAVKGIPLRQDDKIIIERAYADMQRVLQKARF